jgi:hypothetical protein
MYVINQDYAAAMNAAFQFIFGITKQNHFGHVKSVLKRKTIL